MENQVVNIFFFYFLAHHKNEHLRSQIMQNPYYESCL